MLIAVLKKINFCRLVYYNFRHTFVSYATAAQDGVCSCLNVWVFGFCFKVLSDWLLLVIWHCPCSMQSRVYEAVGRPYVCPSVCSSRCSGFAAVGPAARRHWSIAARLVPRCQLMLEAEHKLAIFVTKPQTWINVVYNYWVYNNRLCLKFSYGLITVRGLTDNCQMFYMFIRPTSRSMHPNQSLSRA